MNPRNNEVLSPREHLIMENENAQMKASMEHAINLKKLEIEAKKLELRLRQEEAVRARRHAQQMRELELAIRQQEVRWQQLLRLPTLLLKLPVLILLGIAYICAVLTRQDINNTEFWRYLR